MAQEGCSSFSRQPRVPPDVRGWEGQWLTEPDQILVVVPLLFTKRQPTAIEQMSEPEYSS